MSTEEFWDLYINSSNTLDIYDEVIAFFSEELPKNFEDEYDVMEVIVEVQGHHKEAKEFEKVIKFINLIKEKQPKFYDKISFYSNEFLISHYAYQGNIIEANLIFQNITKNIVEYYDEFSSVLKKLLFYQNNIVIDNIVDNFYETIRDSDELIDKAHFELSNYKRYSILEKYYLESLTNSVFDNEKIVQELSKYGFDDSEQIIFYFENGFFEILDLDTIQDIFKKNEFAATIILQAMFIKAMLQKGINFQTTAVIWDIMANYWDENNKKGKNYFAIDANTISELISNFQGFSFSNDKTENFAVLWGSVYIYDFLLEKGLIDASIYNTFIKVNQELKGIQIAKNISVLWEYDFVHRWQKPNGITEAEFVNETKIFQKSKSFSKNDFANFKPEIQEELDEIGALSRYIDKANDAIIKNNKANDDLWRSSLNKKGFFENIEKEDYFIPPTDLKPIVKSANEKIGRNDPCHCGSGKKFKKCCLIK